MGRKKKKDGPSNDGLWLVTFTDLMTLLLTFLVLLLSMATMDNTVISKINPFKERTGVMNPSSLGKISQRIVMAQKIMEKPVDIIFEKDRIKDLLFPDDVMPPEINRSDLENNLKILAKNDGVALVIADKLLFEYDQARLSVTAIPILQQIGDLLKLTSSDVVISGFAEPTEANPEELAGDRAIGVLMQFESAGLPSRRFAIAAYVGRPDIELKDFPARRVEIFIKTSKPLGGY